MKQEFYIRLREWRSISVDSEDGETYLSFHVPGGHLGSTLTKSETFELFKALESIVKAQEGA